VHRLGLPDRYVEHGERGELLAELGLDAPGIAARCRQACEPSAAEVPIVRARRRR